MTPPGLNPLSGQKSRLLAAAIAPGAWSLRTRFLIGTLFCVALAFGLLTLWIVWARYTSWPWGWFYVLLIATIAIVYLTARWISRSVLAPVTSLAERLSRIDPRERGVRIGGEFSLRELAPIAASADRFLERLDGFVEREQSFTTTASHELRTPLAVVQGAAEIVIEQTRPCQVSQKALARIQRATGEMSEFIDALLMLSREAQAESGCMESCDVGEIASRVMADDREALGGRQVTIECCCDSNLQVNAPGSLVTILVRNLVRNATAHTTEGSITCRIDGRTLAIRDTGPGIPPEHLAQVFDRNFTTRPGGNGLGLYLSKRICDRYGWQIALKSCPQGTTALVTF